MKEWTNSPTIRGRGRAHHVSPPKVLKIPPCSFHGNEGSVHLSASTFSLWSSGQEGERIENEYNFTHFFPSFLSLSFVFEKSKKKSRLT
jgi:hypothetical protein